MWQPGFFGWIVGCHGGLGVLALYLMMLGSIRRGRTSEMNALMKVIGWSLRASAAICMTWIVVSVAQGRERDHDDPGDPGSVAFHAVFALGGRTARRRSAKRGTPPSRSTEAAVA